MPSGETVTTAGRAQPLLQVRELRTHFSLEHSAAESVLGRLAGRPPRALKAVDGVSFDVARGETLGLVGESACGKTTLGRSILRLVPPTAGEVLFEGTSVGRLTRSQLRALRPRMQIVFQDPGGALNPRRTLGAALARALSVVGVRDRRARAERGAELLAAVGLPAELASRYPHQLSGGQQQRACIARALATGPDFIVADEPVSSLDVSVQAQILQLLAALQRERHLALLFISHDLSVVRQVSHRIAVMYAGRIVEIGPAQRVIDSPQHPYTQQLLEAVPRLHHHWDLARETPASRDAPIASRPATGCPFEPRCTAGTTDTCRQTVPQLADVEPDHQVACHLCGAD